MGMFLTKKLGLGVIRVKGDKKAWMLRLPQLDRTEAKKLKTSWGAGWSYENKVYFANNGGGGVYQVDINSIKLRQKTANIAKVGSSVQSKSNDGLNCIFVQTPFPP